MASTGSIFSHVAYATMKLPATSEKDGVSLRGQICPLKADPEVVLGSHFLLNGAVGPVP